MACESDGKLPAGAAGRDVEGRGRGRGVLRRGGGGGGRGRGGDDGWGMSGHGC